MGRTYLYRIYSQYVIVCCIGQHHYWATKSLHSYLGSLRLGGRNTSALSYLACRSEVRLSVDAACCKWYNLSATLASHRTEWTFRASKKCALEKPFSILVRV